jgi:glutamate--cysteine ligase
MALSWLAQKQEVTPLYLLVQWCWLAARRDPDLARSTNETGFLDSLREMVRSGKTPAEQLLERYHGAWGSDVSGIYEEMKF